LTENNFISPIVLKQRSAGKDIVASGSVHTFDNKNLEIDISGLCLVFEFKNDSGEQRLEREICGEKSLKLNVFNFSNSLGTGTTIPIPIGTINNRHLYLSFIVHSLSSESSKVITYTFFLGETVNG
jgi:hypothetical protein